MTLETAEQLEAIVREVLEEHGKEILRINCGPHVHETQGERTGMEELACFTETTGFKLGIQCFIKMGEVNLDPYTHINISKGYLPSLMDYEGDLDVLVSALKGRGIEIIKQSLTALEMHVSPSEEKVRYALDSFYSIEKKISESRDSYNKELREAEKAHRERIGR